ncbi:MAG TPA: right-handed parallel beta-helix repeat-containing protein [Syntrophales bacterium]|nr:right-handed parallel beta-helix repeat-containing protein [Syntrophales bacterium]
MRNIASKAKCFLLLVCICFAANTAWGLDAPGVTATAKGPNQINLTWGRVSAPGWGYKVEIQSSGDSRYSSWTDLTAALINGRNYLPYWVTEPQYRDPTDGSGTSLGSACQFPVFGLKYGTAYNFRVRSYGKNDSGAAQYSSYSSTASATTYTPSIIRHVKAGGPYGSGDGTSEANAWGHIYNANSLSAGTTNGTLIIVHGGNYAGDGWAPSNSGASPSRKIVLQVDPGETATVTSTGANNQVVNMGSRSYVVVDGLKTTASATNEIFTIGSGGSRNIWANCEVNASAIPQSVYTPYVYGSYNLLHQNYMHDVGRLDQSGGSGTGFTGSNAAYNYLQYCRHEKNGHDQLLMYTNSHHNAVLNNLFDGGYGMAWETHHQSNRCLFEGNIAKNAAKNQPGVYKPNIEISSDYHTIRRNFFLSGSSHAIELSAIEGATAQGNLIYNNVIYGNTAGGIWYMQGSATQANNIWANNIIYNNMGNVSASGMPSPTYVEVRGDYTGTKIHHNCILYASPDNPGAAIINFNASGSNMSVMQANSSYSSYFYSNVTTTPNFVDTAYFHLKSTSGLIDAGAVVSDSTWGNISYTGSSPDIGAFEYSLGSSSGGGSSTPISAPRNLRIVFD